MENIQNKEFAAKARKGGLLLCLFLALNLIFIAAFVFGIIKIEAGSYTVGGLFMAAGILFGFIVIPVLYAGFRVVKPNEAMVLTFFGKYVGTIRKEGFYYVNPFCIAVSPDDSDSAKKASSVKIEGVNVNYGLRKNRISTKAMTLNNDKQKINDLLGNPIIIGIVVIWKVTDTYKAAFSVENYFEFLSIQCDSALRNIVRLYPYDSKDDAEAGEKSLRGSSQEIADKLRAEIQEKVDIAGLEILEARITNLAYAPEIAAAMLQRQQAAAIVDARQLIVDGAVGMVEMALDRLLENNVVSLDDERKAAMVSNLLVVLCGNRDAQPIVNSGSIY